MSTLAGPTRSSSISRKNRTLLAAALLALGPGKFVLHAQTDLSAVRTRAEQGDPEALNALANAYANGQGVPQNFAEALRLYQQAGDRGLAAAQFNLGMMHELGRGVTPDLAAAFKFYLKAAEQGFAPAQFNVGNMYAGGLGTKQDYFEAALWFRQAADSGVPEAQYNLALAYELGRGVAKDEVTALRWYRASAGQRYARAQYNLALMLEEGRGSAVDLPSAVEFYRLAAQQNFAPAQNNLGILLAEGRGGAANLVEAYTWLALAVENGAKPTGRDLVAQQLSSGQLGEANVAIARMRAQLGLRESAPVAAVAAVAPAARPAEPVATEAPAVASPQAVAALNSRIAAAEAELERVRGENARLAGTAQALTRVTSTLEQQLADATRAAAAARGDQSGREAPARQLAAAQAAAGEAREAAARLSAENTQLKSAAAAASQRATAAGAQAANLAALTTRLNAAESDLARLQAENARLTQAAARPAPAPVAAATEAALRSQIEELTRGRAEAQRRSDELAKQLEAARATPATVAQATAPAVPGEAKPTTELSLPQLAENDARIAKLLSENARLNDDVKSSTLELSRLARQLRLAQEQGGSPAAGAPAGSADGARLAELTRELAELRASNEKLAAENRRGAAAAAPSGATEKTLQQLAAVQADLGRLRAENEQLKPAAAAASGLPAVQARAAQAEQALAEATKQRDALSAEKSALEQRLADLAARPSVDPAQVQAMRTQLGEALDEANAARRASEALRTQLAEAGTKLAAALQAQTAGAPNAQQLAGMAQRLATISAERDRLVAAQTAQEAERQNSGRNLAEATAKIEAMQRELTAAREAVAQGGQVTTELASLRVRLAEALAKSTPQQTQLAAQEKTVAELQAKNAKLARDLEAASVAQGGTAAQLAGLRQEHQEKLQLLASALATGEATAKRLAAATTGRDQSAERIAELNAKIDALGRELDGARRAAAPGGALVTELAQAREAGGKLNAELEGANRTVAELNARNSSLLQDLEVAKQSVAAALAAQAAAAKAAPGDAMRLELATLQNQVRALEAQSDEDRKNSAREISTFASQLQAARETNRALTEANRALLQARGSEDASIKSEIDQVNGRLKTALGEWEKSKAEQAQLAADLETRNRELEAVRVAGRVPVQERDNLRGQVEDLFNRLSGSERQVAQLKQAADTAKAEAERTRADYAALQTKQAESAKVAEQHGATVAELTGLNERMAAERTAQEKQLAQARQNSEQAGAELTELKARLAAGTKAMQEQLASVNQLGAANQNLQAQLTELGGQVAALRGDNTRLTAVGELAAKLRTELADTKLRLAEMQKAAEQHGASVAELTGVNQRLAADKVALERQFAQAKQGSELVLAELAELKNRVAAGSRTTQEQLAVINELGATNERLQGQVKELGGQLATLQADNSRLSVAGESAAAFRAELADIKTRLAGAQKVAEQHSATVAELTGANGKLSADLKELQAQQENLRTENSRLAQGDAARQEAEQRAASLTAAAAQLGSAQRDLAAARADVTRLSDMVQALERDRTNRIAQLQQENSAITARLRQAQGTLDQIASAARLINGGGIGAGGFPASAAIGGAPAAPAAGSPAPVTPAPRLHTVTEGDSLTRISVRYYGTGSRWQEIYEANREVLKGENALRPGQRLRIP